MPVFKKQVYMDTIPEGVEIGTPLGKFFIDYFGENSIYNVSLESIIFLIFFILEALHFITLVFSTMIFLGVIFYPRNYVLIALKHVFFFNRNCFFFSRRIV